MKHQIPADFRKFEGFPTRENCDPTDPYQAYLWALVALPMQEGGPMAFPVSYMQFVSKRIWDCFGPPDPAWEPLIKYRRPAANDPNWMTSPGYWVPADEADADDDMRPVDKALAPLSTTQQAELVRELYSRLTPAQRRMLNEQVGGDDLT